MKEKIKQNGFAFCLTIINLLIILFALLCVVFRVAPTQDPEFTTQTPESTLETQAHRRALKNNFSIENTTLQELSTDFWFEQTAGVLGYTIGFEVDSNTLYYYNNGSVDFVANILDELLFYTQYKVNPLTFSIEIVRSSTPYGNTDFDIIPILPNNNMFMYCSSYIVNNYLLIDVPVFKTDLSRNYFGVPLFDVYNFSSSNLDLTFSYSTFDYNDFLSDNFNSQFVLPNTTYTQTFPADEIEQFVDGTMFVSYYKYRNIGDIYQDGVADGNDQGYQLGFDEAQNHILSNPGQYGLYNQTQYDNAIRDAFNDGVLAGGVDPLEKVWQIISNAGNSVASVFNIQILPGITLGTLFGVFIGIPLLIYILLLLRG